MFYHILSCSHEIAIEQMIPCRIQVRHCGVGEAHARRLSQPLSISRDAALSWLGGEMDAIDIDGVSE